MYPLLEQRVSMEPSSDRAIPKAVPDHVGSGHSSRPLTAALFFAEPASTSAESALRGSFEAATRHLRMR
ncbi:hypothetical protein ASF34_18940 [Methylobacterium sp. Leaf106]|nr:hypothetical protein ASF34_18940 [Methylobacterium sp. Leaf106]